jgi:cytochrome c5
MILPSPPGTDTMRVAVLLCSLFAACAHAQRADDAVEQARARWERSPHGAFLARILPPVVTAAQLPQPESAGARLLTQYCVQCHHLPSPAMHTAARWHAIVERMVWRMRGNGNLGALMKEMMAGVRAPDDADAKALDAYLQQFGQREIDPQRYPDLKSPGGRSFSAACGQCHALPDPRRHSAREWPAVVERMSRNMALLNVVVPSRRSADDPDLRSADIVRFLQRNGRPN